VHRGTRGRNVYSANKTSPDRCAIWNDESVTSLGTLYLSKIRTVGRVRVLARNKVRAGHIDVQDLDIVSADSRAAAERPNGFGVFVLRFVLHGATVDLVNNKGPVSTFGANDMALDNWGAVDRWLAAEKITTLGPSGISFVNLA
jgi:hypothetical protein